MGGWPLLFLWRAAQRQLRPRRGRAGAGLHRAHAVRPALPRLLRGDRRALREPGAGGVCWRRRRARARVGSRGAGRGRMPATRTPEWSAPSLPLGIRLRPLWYPERACDFMAANGVRGRGFNAFDLAGYQLYRFWPERERLPFIDIHQTGTRADRDALRATARRRVRVGASLDARHRFDYALLAQGGAGERRARRARRRLQLRAGVPRRRGRALRAARRVAGSRGRALRLPAAARRRRADRRPPAALRRRLDLRVRTSRPSCVAPSPDRPATRRLEA